MDTDAIRDCAIASATAQYFEKGFEFALGEAKAQKLPIHPDATLTNLAWMLATHAWDQGLLED